MNSPPRAGIIGIGAMGMALAERLLGGGWPLAVRDIRAQAEARARALGARVCESPAALAAQCDVVLSLVVDSAQTEEIVFGPAGVAESLAEDAVLIMSSTVAPAYAASLGKRLADRGLHLLDAPVSGGPAKAARGEMSMMAAGTDAAFARAQPLLDRITGRLFRVGAEAGLGSTFKILNNMLAGINLVAACETFALGAKLGVDLLQLFEVIAASSGASWVLGDRIPRFLAGDFEARAALDILKKDLALALDAARAEGFPVFVAPAAQQVYVAASALGHGAEDDVALVKLYAALTRTP